MGVFFTHEDVTIIRQVADHDEVFEQRRQRAAVRVARRDRGRREPRAPVAVDVRLSRGYSTVQ